MTKRSDTFLSLVQSDPANPLFRFSLGQSLLQEGNAQGASVHLEKAVIAKADWMMPKILLGKCYLALGQKERARIVLQEALHCAVSQGHEDPEAELRALLATL